MSKTETWVQEYHEPFEPGPDGEPTRMDQNTRDARELIVQMPLEVWERKYRFAGGRVWRRVH